MSLLFDPIYPLDRNRVRGPRRPGFKLATRRNRMTENVEIPWMIKALKLPQRRRILALGCGAGIEMKPLFFFCKPLRLVGLDEDRRLLRRAEKRLKVREVEAELFDYDIRDLPFVDMSFDIVVDLGLCYRISRKHEALREINRLLIPTGIFVYKTRLNQFFSSPAGRGAPALPWEAAPELQPRKSGLLWASRAKSLNRGQNGNGRVKAPQA